MSYVRRHLLNPVFVPIFSRISYNDIDIIIWHLIEDVSDLCLLHPDGAYLHSIAIRNFSSVRRIKEWLAVRVLLYQNFGNDVTIAYRSTGKPYLLNNSSFISISHTEKYVAFAMSEHRNIGLDIECDVEHVVRVARRVFNSSELFTSEKNQTVIWSAKEVVYKILDKSGICFKEHIHVYLDENRQQWCATVHFNNIEKHISGYYLIYPDFVMVVGAD